MRTTVRLDDQLLTEAREYAAQTGRTLSALLEDALRAFLVLENRPTYGGGGLQPGVDLDNGAELQDLMDGPDAAR